MKHRVRHGLAVVGVLAIGWLVYGLLVPDQAEIAPTHLSSGLAAQAPASAPTLAANLNAPLLDGNAVQMLLNGDQIFPAMLGSIRDARQSVNLLSYIYWEGRIGEQFAHALSDAARRGVQVRVLVDAVGGARMNRELIDEMRRAGCHFAWFHPLRWYSLKRFNNRTHRKVMVVDGRVGFTGGVGIGQVWTGHAQDPEHWRDDQFRVEGPVVRYLQGSFAVNWREATGEVLAGAAMFPTLAPAGSTPIVPIDAAPGANISQIGFVYWTLFHSAQHEIRITTPYFVPDPDLDLGIAAAAQRGVKVTLLVPGPHQDSALSGDAGQTYYKRLLQAGVKIYEFQPTMLHTKAVTVDGHWAIIGSPNFDSRSFSLNYEEALAVYDPSLVAQLRASFDADIARSKPVTLKDVDAWPPWIRLRNYLALTLRAQL
jgi:cardiolipin synthase